MTERREGEDGPQEPQDITFADLLSQIRTGGVEGLLSQGGFRVLPIRSTPTQEADIFVDPRGNIVHSFTRKFGEGFEGWKPGERVKSKFLVYKKTVEGQERLELLVSESVTGDIRHSDTFVLEGVSPQDEEALLAMGIRELDANVLVTSDKTYRVSNMFEYRARLDCINGIQEIFDGDFSKLEPGPVLLEGEIKGYKKGKDQPAIIQVQIAPDQVVPVELFNGYLNFEGGCLEISEPNQPLLGDIVQINARFADPNARHGGKGDPKLFAYFCRSTYLLAPSQERAEAYAAQRQKVEEGLGELQQAQSPKELRTIHSRFIQSNLRYPSSLSFAKLNLIESEIVRLHNTITAKLPDPKDRPIDVANDIYVAEELNGLYDVDVYAMTKDEFLEFCMGVSRGNIVPVRFGSVDYHYRVMDTILSQDEQEQVLHTAIRTFFDKVVGKRMLHRPREQGGHGNYDPKDLADPHNTTFDAEYLFDQSLGYASGHMTPNTVGLYLELVQRVYDKELFIKENSERLCYPDYKLFDSIRRQLWNCAEWNNGEIVGIRNPEIYKLYLDQHMLFRNLRIKLMQQGWTNDGRRNPSSSVEEVLDLMQRIADVF